MKRNIVVCCEEMLRGDPTAHLQPNRKPATPSVTRPAWQFCPWCGKKLPFPYEEGKDG